MTTGAMTEMEVTVADSIESAYARVDVDSTIGHLANACDSARRRYDGPSVFG